MTIYNFKTNANKKMDRDLAMHIIYANCVTISNLILKLWCIFVGNTNNKPMPDNKPITRTRYLHNIERCYISEIGLVKDDKININDLKEGYFTQEWFNNQLKVTKTGNIILYSLDLRLILYRKGPTYTSTLITIPSYEELKKRHENDGDKVLGINVHLQCIKVPTATLTNLCFVGDNSFTDLELCIKSSFAGSKSSPIGTNLNFENCLMCSVDFSGCEFTKVSFKSCRLAEANFTGFFSKNVTFEYSNLLCTNLTKSYLSGSLTGCALSWSRLNGAYLMDFKGLTFSELGICIFDIIYVDKKSLLNMGIAQKDINAICPDHQFFAIKRDSKNHDRFNIVAQETAAFIKQVTTTFPILKDDPEFQSTYNSEIIQNHFGLFSKSVSTKEQSLEIVHEDFEINLSLPGSAPSTLKQTPGDINFKSV